MAPRKLWQRSFGGGEVEATMFPDHVLNECTVELSVRGMASENTLAAAIADGVLAALDARGAVPLEQET
jgi:hypothetical protein